MNKFIFNDGGRSEYFKNGKTFDCVIRSIAIASELDYKIVWTDLLTRAIDCGELPNNKNNYEPYLLDLGFIKNKPHRVKGKTVRVREFPTIKGYSYIIHTREHLTALKGGFIRDTWDCGRYHANNYYIRKNK